MNICHLTKLFPPSTGGAEMYWHNLSNSLGRRGHNIDVITQSYVGIDGDVDSHENVTVHRIRNSRRMVNLDTLAFSLKSRYVVDFSDYDVIHGSLRPASTVALPTKSFDAPVVLTSHGTSYDAYKNTGGKSIKDMLFKHVFHPTNIVLDYYAGQRCNAVIAVSDHVADRLSNFYNINQDNISQITPGLDTRIFYPRRTKNAEYTDPECFTLLFVGRIEPIKGIDILIKSLEKICDRANIELIIVGKGSDEKRLRSLAESYDVEDTIKFVGQIEHEQLPVLYSNSDLLVLPSEYESLSFVVREAMACGLPTLCADVGGISTSVTHENNGYLVDRTPASFKHALKNLMQNPERVKELGRNAASSAQNWSWDMNAQETETLYKKLVSES